MIRKIIKIDEDKCNGCGFCANACHEGAIAIVDGKAKLLRDDYCDGLGNCLPVCPEQAISFEEREAAAFDEEAVKSNIEKIKHPVCPGSMAKKIEITQIEKNENSCDVHSRLSQWPCQIKLIAPNAPYFNSANLLVAADCTAFAYGNFHEKFIKDHITLIGCPKLDDIDYSEKLTAIIKNNDIRSITVARMEVPCCGGISNAVVTAIRNSGKILPLNIVTISIDGEIRD